MLTIDIYPKQITSYRKNWSLHNSRGCGMGWRPAKVGCSYFSSGGKCDVIFNIENKCSYSIWLGASPSNGNAIVEHGPDTLEVLTMSNP